MALKLRVKKCAPSLFSQSVVGQLTPKWWGLESMHTVNRKTIPTQTPQFHICLYACPASAASTECIFSTYDLVWSKIGKSSDA